MNFKKRPKWVKRIQVTNDMAENGMVIIQEFADTGRKASEDQFHFVLQVVSQQYKEYPKAAKNNMKK